MLLSSTTLQASSLKLFHVLCWQVAVVLALALPFLSLSFGYNPSKAELDEAAQLIEAHAEDFDGWEICSLLWAAARLGYRPSPAVMDGLLHQVSAWSTV